jgi:hypothetical protein
MISKTIITICFVTLMNFSGDANGCCFTMPPKVVKVSKWAFSLPNIESSSYIHESHLCPSGYKLESQHSHIVRSMSTDPKIIELSIYGYSVCCEEKVTHIKLNKKNETLYF